MTCFTVTILDKTQPVPSLLALISQGNTAHSTITPPGGESSLPVSVIGDVSYLSIQAGTANSAGIIYKGDEFVKNDGSRQGKALAASAIDVVSATGRAIHLGEVFVTGNTNGNTYNVEIHYS